jgi:hypothetical protein
MSKVYFKKLVCFYYIVMNFYLMEKIYQFVPSLWYQLRIHQTQHQTIHTQCFSYKRNLHFANFILNKKCILLAPQQHILPKSSIPVNLINELQCPFRQRGNWGIIKVQQWTVKSTMWIEPKNILCQLAFREIFYAI